jgi:hypothetical protein
MADGEFGSALALSADASTLVVGATQESDGEGAVYIDTAAAGSGLWSLQRKLRPADVGGVGQGNFGKSVAVSASGDTLAVGASTLSSVVVFVRNAGGVWTNQTGLIHCPSSSLTFGWSVSMNAAGDAVAIGAPFDQTSGRVYTLTRSMDDAWGPLRVLNVSDSATVSGRLLGYWVSMSAQGSLVIGAVGEVPAGAWWSVNKLLIFKRVHVHCIVYGC